MSDTVVYRGPGTLSILFLIFLTLKLIGVISWSWWYITMPLWIGPVILFSITTVGIFIMLIVFGVGLIINK